MKILFTRNVIFGAYCCIRFTFTLIDDQVPIKSNGHSNICADVNCIKPKRKEEMKLSRHAQEYNPDYYHSVRIKIKILTK